MNTQSILHFLALIAAALGLDHNNTVESAKLANKVAKFKEDNAITGDAESALGAVLRAAETAPVSADSARAAAVTAEHLPGEDADGKAAAAGLFAGDTKPGTRPLEKGDLGPTNESGAEGEEGQPGVPESVQDLVDNNSKDDLLALAEKEGVDVNESSNKSEIAQAIVDARKAAK